MKKILSLVIAAAMLLSLAVVMSVPAAAVDGEWIVYSKADHEKPDYEGDPMSIPGYEYNDDGLHVIPADWRDFKPGAGVQRKEKSDITEGVYMQVRIDAFSYEADGWFNFNLYSQSPMKPGRTEVDIWGYGVQTLVRYNAGANRFDIGWYTDGFQNAGSSQIPSENFTMGEDGSVVFEFVVEYDGNTFSASINGSSAPEKVITYMNELYTKEEAYVGFNLQNSVKGGTCECTVLLYGNDEDSATVPAGEDGREPRNNYIEIAEIADPSTVEAGKPAVMLTGDRINSATKKIPGVGGGSVSVLEDYTLHAVAEKTVLNIDFDVKNNVSYSIDDFPVMLVLAKNYCTCDVDEGEACWAVESVNMYPLTGEFIGADNQHKVNELNMNEEVALVGDDSYLYFYYDISKANWDAEGRINGVRIDFTGIDINTPGRNAFDVCYAAFFASEEDAIAFTEKYLTDLGWSGEYGEVEEDGGDDTDAPGGNDTDAPGGNDTDAPGGNDTDAPGGNETDAPGGNETNKPGNDKEDNDDKNNGTNAPNNGGDSEAPKGGCGSVVGFGVIAIVTLAAGTGFVSFKKRK